jgi:hypothetical protein
MYMICRSCWITVLVLPTHALGEAILQTSKIHNLFIQYPNNTSKYCKKLIVMVLGKLPYWSGADLLLIVLLTLVGQGLKVRVVTCVWDSNLSTFSSHGIDEGKQVTTRTFTTALHQTQLIQVKLLNSLLWPNGSTHPHHKATLIHLQSHASINPLCCHHAENEWWTDFICLFNLDCWVFHLSINYF